MICMEEISPILILRVDEVWQLHTIMLPAYFNPESSLVPFCSHTLPSPCSWHNLLFDHIFPGISCKWLHISVCGIHSLLCTWLLPLSTGCWGAASLLGSVSDNFLFVAMLYLWREHTRNLWIHSPLEEHLVLSSIVHVYFLLWMMLPWTSTDKLSAGTCVFNLFPKSGISGLYV